MLRWGFSSLLPTFVLLNATTTVVSFAEANSEYFCTSELPCSKGTCSRTNSMCLRQVPGFSSSVSHGLSCQTIPLSLGPKHGIPLQLPCELTWGWQCTSPEGKVSAGSIKCWGCSSCARTKLIPTKSDKFFACFAGSLRPVLKFHHLILPLLKFQQNIKFSLISCSKFSTLNWRLIQLLGLH